MAGIKISVRPVISELKILNREDAKIFIHRQDARRAKRTGIFARVSA